MPATGVARLSGHRDGTRRLGTFDEEHELIVAQFKDLPHGRPVQRLSDVLETLGLEELRERFFTT